MNHETSAVSFLTLMVRSHLHFQVFMPSGDFELDALICRGGIMTVVGVGRYEVTVFTARVACWIGPVYQGLPWYDRSRICCE